MCIIMYNDNRKRYGVWIHCWEVHSRAPYLQEVWSQSIGKQLSCNRVIRNEKISTQWQWFEAAQCSDIYLGRYHPLICDQAMLRTSWLHDSTLVDFNLVVWLTSPFNPIGIQDRPTFLPRVSCFSVQWGISVVVVKVSSTHHVGNRHVMWTVCA